MAHPKHLGTYRTAFLAQDTFWFQRHGSEKQLKSPCWTITTSTLSALQLQLLSRKQPEQLQQAVRMWNMGIPVFTQI